MSAELDGNRATTLSFRQRTNGLDGHVPVLVDEAPDGFFVDALRKDHAAGDVLTQVAAAGVLLVSDNRQMVSFQLDVQSIGPIKYRLTEGLLSVLAHSGSRRMTCPIIHPSKVHQTMQPQIKVQEGRE